jgi:hypothetical protein
MKRENEFLYITVNAVMVGGLVYWFVKIDVVCTSKWRKA